MNVHQTSVRPGVQSKAPDSLSPCKLFQLGYNPSTSLFRNSSLVPLQTRKLHLHWLPHRISSRSLTVNVFDPFWPIRVMEDNAILLQAHSIVITTRMDSIFNCKAQQNILATHCCSKCVQQVLIVYQVSTVFLKMTQVFPCLTCKNCSLTVVSSS